MIYLWAGIGLLQWLIDPHIFEFVVNTRTTDERGVTSLAPEPSSYGLTVIQMWLLLLLIQPKTAFKGHIVLLSLFQILLLAQSMLAILVIFAIFIVFTLRGIRHFLVSAACIIALLLLFRSSSEFGGRFFMLIDAFVSEPSQILYFDGSISHRFYHLFLSFKHAIANGLLPHGFDAFSAIIHQAKARYDSFWWGEAENKIMSGLGAAVFELGFFSLTYLLVFCGYLIRYNNISGIHRMAIGIGMVMILLNSVTFAAPYFGLMIGLMAARIDCFRRQLPNDS
jgi:hypothetical protein